jgi:hypothetical protein
MIVIPLYLLTLVPVLNVWWTHRRCDRREYQLLTISFLISWLLLAILSQCRHLTATRYQGPMAASGIETEQILAAFIVTPLITIIPVKWKLLRDLAALIVGEAIILRQTWVS